jgi:hypothetical protein
VAPEARAMYAASPPLKRVLSGTSTAPARSAPRAASIHSAQLGAQMATRSVASTPAATKPRA